ncbi:hypothetical protein F5883DRAFT_237794 [Diaporthe sp. PMI_573]|nr:hypothetical protein F5883DRAFT_237794 [Diaporthaceae sp. PMI_573]
MDHGTRISVPSSRRHITAQPRRPGSPAESLEDSNSDNPLCTLEGDSLQNPTLRPNLLVAGGPNGHDQEYERLTSTERSSSTCVVLDDPTEPHASHTSSFPRLITEKEGPSAPSRQSHIHSLRNWKWEVLSILTSLGLLIAILVTLARYNHGTQPEWPYNINVNSLLSVFTTVIIAQLGFILVETSSSGSGLTSHTRCKILSTTTQHREGQLAVSFFWLVLRCTLELISLCVPHSFFSCQPR